MPQIRRVVLDRLVAPLVLATLPLGLGGQELQDLPLGTTASGSSTDEAPGTFGFSTEGAGFLTVIVRGHGDVDLAIMVTDAVGQPLADGESDQDLLGDAGAEQLTVTIPRAGRYEVRVRSLYGGGTFDIAGSWISFPRVAIDDPDWSPVNAGALPLGETVADVVNSGGDLWDWYAITADRDGVLAVALEAPLGDLVLEIYGVDDFAEAISRSDQDLDGVTGNEAVAVSIRAGQTLYVKVQPLYASNDEAIAYTIRAGIT